MQSRPSLQMAELNQISSSFPFSTTEWSFEMKFNLRQTIWIFAIAASLFLAPGLARGYQQDDHGRGQDRGQDDRHGNQQNGAPGGGYAQTCQDIRTNGTTLEAKCQTRDGNWNQTSLQNFNQCTGGIENDDGRLVCNKGSNSGEGYRQGDRQGDRHDNGQGYRHDDQQNGAPSGGYTQTCKDIRTSGNALQANCQKKNGKWKQSSLRNFNRCSSEIENNNGKLVCSR
jgi:CVNH domain